MPKVMMVLGVCLLLAGCAAGGPAGTGAEAHYGTFCRCGDAIGLIAYQQRIRGLSGDELAVEYAAASQAMVRQKSDAARLRLAMLLSLPGATFRDDERAAALAEEVANRRTAATADGLRPLAALIAVHIGEQRRQEDRNQKLAQKLQEEEKRADALQQKLDGLKAIEKSMLNREPAKPVNVR